MSKRNHDSFFETPFMRIILAISGAVLSAVVLMLSSFTILEIYNKSYEAAPKYLVWIFILVGLMSAVSFLKKRTKMNFIRCIFLLIFNVIIGVISLFGKDNPLLFSITTGLYCLSIVISCVFHIIMKRDIRSVVLYGLIIAFAVGMCVGMFTLNTEQENNVIAIITMECIFVAIVSFVQAAIVAFAQMKVKILIKIILNTYSLEILFGLLTMIVCFSIVLYTVEEKIETFADALWYSFAVVTTIGFGDYVAVTPLGRILTVILGLYGLIVVAVITSIIVNFYNETAGKKDAKELKEIKKDEKRNE